MHRTLHMLLAGLALLVCLPAGAQSEAGQARSIESLQRMALQRNGLAQAARQSVVAAEAGVVSASALPNPEVEIMGGKRSAADPGAVPGSSHGVFVSQRIERPLLRQSRISSASAGIQVAIDSQLLTYADLAAQVRVRAYEYLLRREQARTANEEVGLLEGVRKRVKVRVDSGEAPKLELIRADAEWLSARSRAQAAQGQVEVARALLSQVVGDTLGPDFQLGASLEDAVPTVNAETLREEVLRTSPELARLSSELLRAQRRVEMEKAAVLPGVQVRMGQQSDPDLRSNVVGLTFAVPLFDRRSGPIAEAGADVARAQAMLDARRFQIVQEAAQVVRELEIARRTVEELEQGVVTQAEAALRVAESAYRFGERGILEVLDAQRVLRSARVDLLNARYALQLAAANVDRLRAAYPKETM